MKNLIFILFFAVSVVGAQERGHQKIKALKAAYITEKLDLTPTEAENFWPVYNELESQAHQYREQKRKKIYKKIRTSWQTMTDQEANDLIDEYLQIETKVLELRKAKVVALRKVISPKKIISLKITEEDFKRELLDKYRKRKSEKKNR